MRRNRHQLKVGDDGTAEVVCLTDPIPRHVSIVDWGANNLPATSWKAAGDAGGSKRSILRAVPVEFLATSVGEAELVGFIEETTTAWEECVHAIVSAPLQPADRSAQVQAVTIQAGARIAAALTVLGKRAKVAAKSFKVDGFSMPLRPTSARSMPTIESQIDRAAIDEMIIVASVYMLDSSMAVAASSGSTDEILGNFQHVSEIFCGLLASLPAGSIGVRTTATSSRKGVMITIEQLSEIAKADPVGFLRVINTATKAAAKAGPEGLSESKKFMWGETGVDPFDPDAILSGLVGFQSGAALQGAIASAVAGIDVAKATGTGVTVAASFKKAVSNLIADAIKNEPDGALAEAIKGAIAVDIGQAVVETIKAYSGGAKPSGGLDFEPDEGTDLSLQADLPSLSSNRR